ncbi:MAG: GntR family transcriptional regulator [Erysipelothrix sp.]|nr:GntR family transcriptional regulator [Erysipelothrix sp.]
MKITMGSIPIYRQIIDYFELEIASGSLEPGEKIDSIRNLAQQFKVNPNTVQKALLELERDNYIYTDRTNGKFVTENEEIITGLKKMLIERFATEFIKGISRLGFTKEEVLHMVSEAWEVVYE